MGTCDLISATTYIDGTIHCYDKDASEDVQALFQDQYDSGDLTHTENGVSYGNTNVSSPDTLAVNSNNASIGSNSLEFKYAGNSDRGDDSWCEQRVTLGAEYDEMWIEMVLNIPADYEHREVVLLTGTVSTGSFVIGDTVTKDGTSNTATVRTVTATEIEIEGLNPDQFSGFRNPPFNIINQTRTGTFAVTARAGGATNNKVLFHIHSLQGGVFTGFECNPVAGDYGSSGLDFNYGWDGGAVAVPAHSPVFTKFVDKATDLGTQVTWVVHVKPGTSVGANNGVMQVWKNGTNVLNETSLDNHNTIHNLYEEMYLMGWWNSGNDIDIAIALDDFTLADNNIFGVTIP